MNENLYSLEGKYSKVARKLNPYTINKNSPNRCRSVSDDCSLAISKKRDEYSFKDLAILALNFTEGKCFYSGEQLVSEKKILVKETEIQRDHLFPASRCGLYAYGNVVISTSESNLEKSDMDPYEYYEYRFQSELPTLYDTLEEAHRAIDFLASLYKLRYPLAAHVIESFNEIRQRMPLSRQDFYNLIESPLYYGLNDVKYIDNGVRGATFEYSVTEDEKDKVWLPLLDETSVVYSNTEELIVDQIYSREVYRLANAITNANLNVLKMEYDEISSFADDLVKDMSTVSVGKSKVVVRAVIRQLGVNSGHIDKFGNVLVGSYLPVYIRPGYSIKGTENMDSLWNPLLDAKSTVYLPYEAEALDRIIPKEIFRMENIFFDKEMDPLSMSYNEVRAVVESEVEGMSLSVKNSAYIAMRALIRQMGIVNGDIDGDNNVIKGDFDDLFLRKTATIKGVKNLTSIWTPLLNADSTVYKGTPSSSLEKIIPREIIRLENLFYDKDLNPVEMSFKSIETILNEEFEDYSLSTRGYVYMAMRALMRQIGVINNDIDSENNVIRGEYQEVILNRGLDFDPMLKDIDFWEALNNKDAEVWARYSDSTKKDFIGSRIVHMSNLFAKDDKSVLALNESEIDSLVDVVIDEMTKNQRNKMRAIKRAIFRMKETWDK